MFQEAIKKAQEYIRPVVICFRREDNSTASMVGSFILLNEEGWILTAYHIVNAMENMEK